MAERTHSAVAYWIVYVALMLLLALTFGLAFIDFGRVPNMLIAMGIGLVKAILIALIFMHLKWRPWLTWVFAGAGFVWLGILIVLTGGDYVTRNHPAGDCPKGEPVFFAPQGR